MKKFLYLLIVLLLCLPAVAQDGNAEKDKEQEEFDAAINDQVYSEIVVEDFETNEYTNKNVKLRVTKYQKFGIQMRTVFPAPVKDSKKYLGIKIYGRRGDVLTIMPPKPLEIKDHIQSISVWVYGKNFAGELSLVVKDANRKVHRLSFGKLNFLGWRKLTYRFTKSIAQEDKYLAQPRSIQILQIQYNPGNTGRLGKWNYFYLDNISAKVRKKYEDRQSDDW